MASRTLPSFIPMKFNMEPENGHLGKGDPYMKNQEFSGSMLNFGGVVLIFQHLHLTVKPRTLPHQLARPDQKMRQLY